MTNLGASLGTALAGSLLLATLASSFATNIQNNPDIPSRVKSEATTKLESGVPFVSDADLEAALDESHANRKTTDAALDSYRDARLDGLRAALTILAVMALIALFVAEQIPSRPVGSRDAVP